MKKLLYQTIQKVIGIAFCCLLFVPVGFGQNYSQTFNVGSTTFTVNGFPDVACNNPSGVFVPNDPNCISSPTCLLTELDNTPLSEYHVMSVGVPSNFSITFSTNSTYQTPNVNVGHISNIGLPEQTETPLAGGPLSCIFPPCSETMTASITPTNGSLTDVIYIEFPGLATYFFPIVVTGPINTDVPALGTIITPQIPYLILHDPPGDGSFSAFEQNTTVCRSSSTTYEESFGAGVTATAKIGVAGSVGIVVEQDFEYSVSYTQNLNVSFTNMNSSSNEVCIETVNSFQTSSLSDATNSIGDGADVFVGYGETLVWGVYDIVTYDGCTIGTNNGLVYYPLENGYTKFIKTANDINADIALQLSIAEDMSNNLETRTRAYNQVEVWEDVLALNEMNVANASEFIGNYNFSGTTSSSYSEGITTTQVQEISYNVAVDIMASINIVAMLGANGFTGGPQFTFTNNSGATTTSSTNNSEIISYTLEDDDSGDILNCSAYKDPSYGTPIFRLTVGAKTSCPYEGGIRRDQPAISFTGVSCNGTDASILDVVTDVAPISMMLELCNNSTEERIYQLSLDGNNNNAIVTEGGIVLTNSAGVGNTDHTIAASVCKTVTVGIDGNGNTDHNFSFLLSPQCGGLTDVELGEAAIANLNISFQAGATYQAATNCNRLFVDKTATGENNGTSWNNAFNYLQDAIAAAVSGDTICVAGGIYYPDEGANQTDNDQNASFSMKNGVVILGGFEGTESFAFDVNQRDIAANETILSGDIDQVQYWNGNSYQIVYNTNIDNTAVLDGFTISEGGAIFSPTNQDGAGIYNDNASPLIRNCFIHRNLADVGAGMYLVNNSNPVITNCNFMLNLADVVGGAIAIAGSIPTISYCSFSGNQANVNGPAIRVFSTGNINISHSILWGNGTGSGVLNIDILFSGGIGSCNYCIIDADGGGTNPGVGGLNQDPLFVNQPPVNINSTGGDLRLQAGSPAIDFISNPSGPMIDQDGKMRPIGAGHDIGAYEFGVDCPSSFNLTGTLNSATDYETSGILQSTQIISSNINVQYDSGNCIELNSGFEVILGADFEAFIDGCGNVLQAEIEQQ